MIFEDFDFSRCNETELAQFFQSVYAHAQNNCNIPLGGVLGLAEFVRSSTL